MARSALVWLTLLILMTLFAPAEVAGQDKIKITPDVVYGHKHGLAMTMDVYQPKKANGAGILFMVSGGWYSIWNPPEKALGLFQPLLDKGFTVFSVRHGSSPKFTIPEAVDDVRRSVRFVRLNAKKYGVDPDRLGVFGGSAGGHLSLMLGTTGDDGNPNAKEDLLRQSDRVAAVVAYFPPTDLRGIVWSAPDVDPQYKRFPALDLPIKQAAKYSPLLAVTKDDAPTLLVHGDKDKLVPLKHSKDIEAALKKAGVTCDLLVIEGAAHGFAGEDGRRATNALVSWFEKHLQKTK